VTKFRIPTKKEFRNNPKNNGMSWQDVYGDAACEECGKCFQPGEIIISLGYKKGYHEQCLKKDEP
jgi:hypothetical protein